MRNTPLKTIRNNSLFRYLCGALLLLVACGNRQEGESENQRPSPHQAENPGQISLAIPENFAIASFVEETNGTENLTLPEATDLSEVCARIFVKIKTDAGVRVAPEENPFLWRKTAESWNAAISAKVPQHEKITQFKTIRAEIRHSGAEKTTVTCSYPSETLSLTHDLEIFAPEGGVYAVIDHAFPQRVLGGLFWQKIQQFIAYRWDTVFLNWVLFPPSASVKHSFFTEQKRSLFSNIEKDYFLARTLQFAVEEDFRDASLIASVGASDIYPNLPFPVESFEVATTRPQWVSSLPCEGTTCYQESFVARGFVLNSMDPIDPKFQVDFGCLTPADWNRCSKILLESVQGVLLQTIERNKPLFVRFTVKLDTGELLLTTARLNQNAKIDVLKVEKVAADDPLNGVVR